MRDEKPARRIVIISGGQLLRSEHAEDLDYLRSAIRPADMVICADSGSDNARILGLKPDLVVGDMDSISSEAIAGLKSRQIPMEVHPVEKDATDTEIAVAHALARGASEVMILAGTGGRLDHELANVMLLCRIEKAGVHAELIDDQSRTSAIVAYGLPVTRVIAGRIGDTLSLIPVSYECKGITLTGMRYPLTDESLLLGSSRGVSNELMASAASITIHAGVLLVVVTRRECL